MNIFCIFSGLFEFIVTHDEIGLVLEGWGRGHGSRGGGARHLGGRPGSVLESFLKELQ